MLSVILQMSVGAFIGLIAKDLLVKILVKMKILAGKTKTMADDEFLAAIEKMIKAPKKVK